MLAQDIVDIGAPVRRVTAKAELYNGSALAEVFSYSDALKSFRVERVGEPGKFFGFVVCQKLNIKLLDKDRLISISTANSFKLYFESLNICPLFAVSEVHRDENTNELSITAYDCLYKEAESHTVSELGLTSYTVGDFVTACAALIGADGVKILNVAETETCFDTFYETGANFDGTETIKEALRAAAEITQTVCYMDESNHLVFKRLDKDGGAVLAIDKEQYFTLESGLNRRLSAITHATELGDNVTAAAEFSGTTQYIRNNPFWDMREDVGTLVSNALAAVSGLTINQFSCEWRGNYLLEIGDKIAITTKDGGAVFSYVLDDVISYSGFLSEKTEWSYTEDEAETASNPSTLGETLKQTYARVNKANKQIDLVASETSANSEAVSSLRLNTESLSASVSTLEKNTAESLETVSGDVAALASEVSAKISSEEVKIEIRKELANGASKVETNTGFTFDDAGLTVEKSGSEMKTQITENGMKVYKDNEETLTADNTGVKAVNLHATTFLIIGTNSRLEDYEKDGEPRTGCFWIR